MPWHPTKPLNTTGVECDGRGRLRPSRGKPLSAEVPSRVRKRVWRRTLITAGVGLLAWTTLAWGQGIERPRSVLMLWSQRSTAPVVTEMDAEFRRTVEAGFDAPVDFHVEYLDLPETTNVQWAPELTDLLRKKYADRPLDLVAVQRAEALNFLLQNRAALFPGVPAVCFDIGHTDFERLQPPADFTAAFYVSDGQRTVPGRRRPTEAPPPTFSASSRPGTLGSRSCRWSGFASRIS
jgi:hypothetical protein